MPVDDLRKNEMMAHLLESLEEGKDIGHYGRLVFAMVGRHFMDEDELVDTLAKDKDFAESEARSLVQQVNERDYNPPRRERILEWQEKQDFPIIPHAENPDEGNVYRDLDFPDGVYANISEYHREKAEADD